MRFGLILIFLVQFLAVAKVRAVDSDSGASLQAEQIPQKTAFKSVTNDSVIFSWQVEGTMLHIRLTTPFAGWVAVGFNPSWVMKGADILIAWRDGDQVRVEDHFGNTPFSHVADESLGGKNNVTDAWGTFTNNVQTIAFSLPLRSGDKYDQELQEGKKVKVLLACRRDNNIRKKHSWKKAFYVNL